MSILGDLINVLDSADSTKTIAKEYKELVGERDRLAVENKELLRILVAVTHHDGALEEHKSVWLPFVERELKAWYKTEFNRDY